MQNLPISSSFEYGAKTIWEHIGLILLSDLAILAMCIIPGSLIAPILLGTFVFAFNVLYGLLLLVVTLCSSCLFLFSLFIGAKKFLLQLHDQGKADIQTIFSCFNLTIFRFLGAAILYCIIVSIGFVFFIIPGIILLVRLQFFLLLMLDRNCGIIESLQKSYSLTRGYTLSLILFALLAWIISALGQLIVFGTLFTLPLVVLAQIYIYRFLLSQNKE